MNEEVYSGKSPFIYHNGLKLQTMDGPGVSEDFFRKCMITGRINPYASSVLQHLYEYGYLNKHMLEILEEKPSKSMQACLGRLVKYGFVVRCYCVYGELSQNTAFFYTLAPAVRGILSKNYADVQTNVFMPDAFSALTTLATNQFIIGIRQYRQSLLSCSLSYIVNIGDFSFRAGCLCSVRGSSGISNFIPMVVRRNPGWNDEFLIKLKAILGLGSPLYPIPVCICEDLVHVRQACELASNDDKLKSLTVMYTTDIALADGMVFEKLLFASGHNSEGDIILQEATFRPQQ